MVLRSVGVLSAGKLMGLLYAVLGLIFGGFFSLLSLAAGAANSRKVAPGFRWPEWASLP